MFNLNIYITWSNFMLKKYLSIALFGVLTGQASATIVFDDGDVHTIDAYTPDNLYLENSSDLNIVGRGVVRSVGEAPAISAHRFDSSGYLVNLSDKAKVFGTVLLPRETDERNQVILNDRSSIIGSSAYGTGDADGRQGVSRADLIEVNDSATIRGGNSAFGVGGAAIGNADTMSYRVSINGGYVIGGRGFNVGGAGVNGEAEPLKINLTKGLIKGGKGGVRGGFGVFTLSSLMGFIDGGKIIGGPGREHGGTGVTALENIRMAISNGYIRGGDSEVDGGSAFDLSGVGYLDISGGSFNAGRGGVNDGYILELNLSEGIIHVTITGGQFGYDNTGNGFIVKGSTGSTGSTIEVHGYDLNFENGVLSGYLLDGSWIDVPFEFFGNNDWTSYLSIVNY
jgi:hypothetical protein